ncbi:hypothetical protein [Streptomyces pseudoechinosporeus]
MCRGVQMPLRAWSGALLVCTLMLCLAGLARPAMAMPSSMASMEMAAPAAAGGHSSSAMQAEAAGQSAAMPMVSGSAQHGAHCPMVEQQCPSPQATLGHDVQPSPALSDVPVAAACSQAAEAQPGASPPALPPPDLHRLCVSRT